MAGKPSATLPPVSQVADDATRYMSGVSARRAEQAIETLNQAGVGTPPPGSERRREPRDPYAGQVSVRLALRTAFITSGGPSRTVFVEVFGRNLSKSGFGFVAPPVYLPEQGLQPAIALRGDEVFTPGKTLEVAIIRREGSLRWMLGRIVRSRTIEDGFVECGVEFA